MRVRPLAAEDLDEADRICRVAFGTFLGVPEPEKTFGDADMVRTRWRADPGAALASQRARLQHERLLRHRRLAIMA